MGLRRVVLTVAFLGLALPILAAGPAYKPTRGTEILWDKWGVPHIYGKTVADMFWGYGWAQTQAHGNLLLTVYGQARGRAAEYWGEAEPTGDAAGGARRTGNLASDRWVWMNGIPERSAVWLKIQKPEFRGYLEAFAAGINAYAAAHPEALSADAKMVLPISALDVMEHEMKFINYTFVASPRLMTSPRTPALDAGVAEQMMGELDNVRDGSNGWAIGPSRSASGKAMLLMNPHLAWAGEQTYFEVQLQAPGINLYGGTQVGLPVLRFSFSDDVAITNTVNTNDGVDLYKLTLKGDGYVFDGKVMPFEKTTHIIKVKQPDGSMKEVPLEIRNAVQGPVVREDAGAPIAMRVAGIDKPYFMEQVWQMDTAHNLKEYQAAVSRLEVPMYNILYADKDGHIEYLFNGDVPRRSEGDVEFWKGVVPGDTSKLVWHDYLTYAELPKIIDPGTGYVQNSNEPPWDAAWPQMLDPKKFPAYLSPTFPLFRSDRALRMLSEDKKISLEMLMAKKTSTRMEMADRMLPDLLAAVDKYGTERARSAATLLAAWDHTAEADSKGALLFYTWVQKFTNTAIALSTAQSQRNFAVPYDFNEPLTTPRGLKDPKAAADMLDAAAEETARVYGAVDTPWGKVMRIQLNGQSNGDATAVRGGPLNGVDLPGNGGPGALGIFRVVTYGTIKDGIKTPVHGDTITIALEFTQPIRAKAFVSYGNSSQPGSPHHTDQLPLMQKKEWRPVWRTRAEIEANLEKKETF
jgi:acyl-homoserine-lactone acylase